MCGELEELCLLVEAVDGLAPLSMMLLSQLRAHQDDADESYRHVLCLNILEHRFSSLL